MDAIPEIETEWSCWTHHFPLPPNAELTVAVQASIFREFASETAEHSSEAARILEKACAVSAAAITDVTDTPLEGGTGSSSNSFPESASALVYQLVATTGEYPIVVLANEAMWSVLEENWSDEAPGPLDALLELELPVSVSLGKAAMPFQDLLQLSTGSVVELDRGLTDYVEVMVNESVIARGEIVVVEGNYGVRIQTVNGSNRTSSRPPYRAS
jgi:flagellar motor switch protein FliN/FliY